MSHPENHSDQEPESEQAEPLNRAERRAQRRGKKVLPPQGHGPAPQSGRHEPIAAPRRAGRRGNR